MPLLGAGPSLETILEEANGRFGPAVRVSAVIATRDKSVLLMRPTKGANAGRWVFPGGKALPTETFAQAARREFDEEVGVALTSDFDRMIVRPTHKVRHEFRWFTTRLHEGVAVTNREPEKCDGLCWFNLDGLPATMLESDRAALFDACTATDEQLELRVHRAMSQANYWAWQGDGQDHLESLTCPVAIDPRVLAQLIAAGGGVCGFVPPTPGYAPCTRTKGHDGPCAHPQAGS